MYRYYNPNPAGKHVIDCTVRAISLITNQSWEEAYFDLASWGAKLYDMPSSNAVWGAFLRSIGFRRYALQNTCPDCYTVKDFCRDHPVGEYVVATSGHVIAVVDGDYYDTSDSGYEIPIYYWRKEIY